MKWLCAILLLAASILPVPLVAGQRAERIAVTPESNKALLVLRSDEVPYAPGFRSGFQLFFGAYDPDQEIITENFFDSRPKLEAQRRYFTDGYLVMDIKPGTYVFKSFVRQDLWSICYNAETVQFTVHAGQALYLGELNSVATMAFLQARATASDKLSSLGGRVDFFDNPRPLISDLDDAGLNRAQEMVASRMPRTTSHLTLAEYTPARFSTGIGSGGGARRCGSREPDQPVDD